MQSTRANDRVIQVPPGSESKAIGALTLAFSSDPVNRWRWPGAAQFLEGFPALTRALGGRAFLAESAFEVADCAGAALWLPPGVEPDEGALVTLIHDTVQAGLRDSVFSLLEQMNIHRPTIAHWYLPLIGVEPVHQRQGLGSLLLQPTLQRCDHERLPAYLESTNPGNIPFYERLGFQRTGVIQAGSSPMITPMIRQPRLAHS